MKRTICLPRHLGKTERLVERLDLLQTRTDEHGPMIIHAVSREQIASENIESLVSGYGPDADPTALRKSFGRCIFTAIGYENEDEELFLIPEVRRYFHRVNETCPHWLLTSALSFPNVLFIAFCSFRELVVTRTGMCVQVTYETTWMEMFFNACLPTTARLNQRAGFSRKESVARLRAFRALAGLPL